MTAVLDGVRAAADVAAEHADEVDRDARFPAEAVRALRDCGALAARLPTDLGGRDASLADVRVVMLTTFELDEYVFEALRLGASGFLLKDAEPTVLLDAIRVVAEGGSLLAPTVYTTAS